MDVANSIADIINRLGFIDSTDLDTAGTWVTSTELYQWADEAAQLLAYRSGAFVTLDATTTVAPGTGTYVLPATNVFTLAAWAAVGALSPSSITINILTSLTSGVGTTGTFFMRVVSTLGMAGTPDFSHSTTYSLATDSASLLAATLAGLASGALLAEFSIEGSILGIASPPDKLFIYDCWALVTYPDASTQLLRPQQFSVLIQSLSGPTGSVTNPGNAINKTGPGGSDHSSYCEIDQSQYNFGGGYSCYLGLSQFVVVASSGAAPAGVPLRITPVRELSALDATWPVTTGPPTRCSFDAGSVGTATLYPIPPGLGVLTLIAEETPPAIALATSTVALPTVFQDLFSYAALAGARGKESEGAQMEMSEHYQGRVDLYLAIADFLFGPGA